MWKSHSLAIVTTLLCAVLLMTTPLGRMRAQGSATPLPLGTIQPAPATNAECPAGYVCSGLEVMCPGVTNSAKGYLAVAAHTQGTPRGLIMFFTGARGTNWWSSRSEAYTLAEELRALGFTIAQVRWEDSWLVSSPGNDAGTARLGCRPATVIRHVYDNYYLPLGVRLSRIGQAGFCVTGNSGGASQVSYALSHYGLENILNVVIPTGGPPHSALAKSLLNNPGEEGYWYSLDTRRFIDEGFGFSDGNGPGARQDPAFTSRWLAESVATGGSDYNHPTTRIHFIIGENDATGQQVVSSDYSNRLRSEGSPFVTVEIVPDTPHSITGTAAGRAALKAAILADQGPPVNKSRRFLGRGRLPSTP